MSINNAPLKQAGRENPGISKIRSFNELQGEKNNPRSPKDTKGKI
jgi:hypothetical protein